MLLLTNSLRLLNNNKKSQKDKQSLTFDI